MQFMQFHLNFARPLMQQVPSYKRRRMDFPVKVKVINIKIRLSPHVMLHLKS